MRIDSRGVWRCGVAMLFDPVVPCCFAVADLDSTPLRGVTFEMVAVPGSFGGDQHGFRPVPHQLAGGGPLFSGLDVIRLGIRIALHYTREQIKRLGVRCGRLGVSGCCGGEENGNNGWQSVAHSYRPPMPPILAHNHSLPRALVNA